jgi:hypothetical protein
MIAICRPRALIAAVAIGGVTAVSRDVAPQTRADGANLVRNANLSEGTFGPAYWALAEPAGTGIEWLQCARPGDDFALRLAGCGQGWAGATSERVKVRPGERLTVAAWVKTDDRATDADRLFVRFFTGGRFVGQTGPAVPTAVAAWRLIEGQVTVPEGVDAADVSLQIWSAGTVWLHSAALWRTEADARAVLPPPACDEFAPVSLPHGKPEDADRNGLPDVLEQTLEISPDDNAQSSRITREKTTSFQTPTGYREDNDLKVDVVIVASNEAKRIRSWQAFGYEAHCMAGFRDGPAYVQEHPDEPQMDAGGTQLTCGPGSYYLVPTANRRRIMAEHFAEAVRNAAQAACPEEPEFFNRAGYSEAFKREWQAAYDEPWQDPASSVNARLKAERLKARLEHQLLADIYQAAREVDPTVPRFLLAHSPINYTGWGITFAHCDMIRSGLVDEMVAQVWTGTARTPIPHCGKQAQRTFENAFLEYSSSWNLVRDTGVPVWFLMDPVEDNPDRAMEDYHDNYERTLAASLMFPDVTRFEVMPWPTRIFGRVPDEFATEITSVINVLSDMQNQRGIEWDCGTEGIATFIADSAMWQRGAPGPSDMADIYGLATPLLMRGVPAQVAHLDRVTDNGYLDPYHTLLLSYDAMKPQSREVNEALAQWVRGGGSLLVCGGDDPYCEADEWWRQAGFHGPTEHLLALVGLDPQHRRVVSGPTGEGLWQTVARTDYTGRNVENQAVEEIDLSPFLREADAVYVKFEDTLKEDGWGPLITQIELAGTRGGKEWAETIAPGTDGEAKLIYHDDNTALTPGEPPARFVDGHRSIVYRLPFDRGSQAAMRVEIGNQYQISASSVAPDRTRTFRPRSQGRDLGRWQLPATQKFVTYDGSGADVLLADDREALILERRAGRGRVVFCGLAPSYFVGSEAGDEHLRALVRRLVQGAGQRYVERPYIKLRRGDYVIARTFDEKLHIKGAYVDVLKPDLPVLDGLRLNPDQLAVLKTAGTRDTEAPRLLHSSSCVEWRSEAPERTRLIVSGALGVRGACRIATAGRKLATSRATAATGREPDLVVRSDGDSVLLTYENLPNGMAIDIAWK